MHARAWCEIDLDALRSNAARLRERAGVPLVPMVKADGYGLGATRVAQALSAPFDGAANETTERRIGTHATAPAVPWGLGVATLAEGEALRRDGCTARLLCCTPVLPEVLPAMRAARITPALHAERDIRAWQALGAAPWHLAIDTGMNRAGVDWRATGALRETVAVVPPQGVFTHFHSANAGDGSRELQEERFRYALEALALPADVLRHTDASLALAARAPALWDLARPGIALYGSPGASALDLQPVARVYARVVEVRDVPVGETVSYDATWTAGRPSRVATVSIGHADGYRRAFSNRGIMEVRGHRVPVVGTVTMDMTMLDVTDLPCEVGDVATVLGDAGSGLTLDEVAALGDLSPYELLVGWRLRLLHTYRETN